MQASLAESFLVCVFLVSADKLLLAVYSASQRESLWVDALDENWILSKTFNNKAACWYSSVEENSLLRIAVCWRSLLRAMAAMQDTGDGWPELLFIDKLLQKQQSAD